MPYSLTHFVTGQTLGQYACNRVIEKPRLKEMSIKIGP